LRSACDQELDFSLRRRIKAYFPCKYVLGPLLLLSESQLLGGWANGIPSRPQAKSQQSPPKLAPRLASLARCSPLSPHLLPPPPAPRSRPTEQQQTARAGGAQEKESFRPWPVASLYLIWAEAVQTWPCTAAVHIVETGFTRPSHRTTCELRRCSMRRVGVRILADRLEVR
jgi:hypothetical protein